MKGFIADLLKYFSKVLFALFIICIIALAVSKYFNYKTSNVFFYVGIACFLIAGGSVIGKNDTVNYQADSVSSRTFYQTTKDSLNIRDNFGFLIFMTIIGLLMLIISSIIEKYSL